MSSTDGRGLRRMLRGTFLLGTRVSGAGTGSSDGLRWRGSKRTSGKGAEHEALPAEQQLLRPGLRGALLLAASCLVGCGSGGTPQGNGPPCNSGRMDCAGVCVDTQSDALHCGSCGNACAGGQVCQVGACVPATGGPGSGGAGTGGIGGSGNGTGGSIAGSGGSATGGSGAGGTSTGGTGNGGSPNGSGGAGANGGAGAGGGAMGACAAPVTGHYQMEALDRGVVAVRVSGGNYVGWRMMGYEYNPEDPAAVSYRLYRNGELVETVTDSTNYLDQGAPADAEYAVSVVLDGEECAPSSGVTPWEENFIRIPLNNPGNYEANDATPADLDGDGQYELVLKWQPNNAQDNSKPGVTDNTILEALELDGTSLWRIDLGRNIRSGAHYTQMSVYDFDGDGRAEIAVKTAPGTQDGTGAFLSMGPAEGDDDQQVFRTSDGYILTGPEYLTVFEGTTGAELATVNYPVPRGNLIDWGDDWGNRGDRFNGGVAMVSDDGQNLGRPSIVQQRGYYERLTMSALHYRDGELTTNWIFDSTQPGNGDAFGQGDHSAMAADMDGDGGQEINTGALTIGSDGTFRCATGRGHGDAQHVGELIIGEGITVFTVYEGTGGYSVHNGNTCEIYAQAQGGDDNGRGVADDIFAGSPGAEFWSSTSSGLMSCADGSNVGNEPGPTNFVIYWDADETRELLDGATISKYGEGNLLTANGCSGNNGTKNTPSLTADLLGDWREELVVRETNNSALRVYTTTDVTARRIYTLMHDPTYRMQVSWEQSSYNQPPHTGFHIGADMADPPKPDIHVK